MKKFLLFALMFGILGVLAATNEPYVATWRGNKLAAVTYTFDDGIVEQYTELFPVFKRLGLKGTFFLNGRRNDNPDQADKHGAKSMSWEMVKEMSDAGQEMSNHGYAHKNHGRTLEAEVEEDIQKNADLIEKVTGKRPLTYAYPNNAKNREWTSKLIRRCGIIASRTYQKSLGGKHTVESADKMVAQAKQDRSWAVFMTHGISVGYDHWGHPEYFFTHLEHVAADKDVWVDTFLNVAIYERLRKETKVEVEESTEGWKVKVTAPKLDKNVFMGNLDLVLPDGSIKPFDPFGGDFIVGAKTPSRSVRFRGIFINDEDWGLRPWAVKHFGKQQQIGTRAYEKVFKVMQADGLNLLWPAMHEGGYEFSSRPENFDLADQYGITIGTSHCEPMLRNNCYLSNGDKKKWSWTNNRDFITDYWREGARRGEGHQVMYTVGMRGIHDGKLQDGQTTEEKKAILEEVFATQKSLLPTNAPTLFCPYKEVLPIFNAGLKVPEDTTIMWVNDNFGYIRRLGGPQTEGCRQGLYWHASYHGRPHGYIHLCTTPPAFLWYELCAKAWNNGVRDVWMLNAGDVFQAELFLSCYGQLANDPEAFDEKAQDTLLTQAVSEKLKVKSEELSVRIVAHLNEYYSLGFNRKPEHMCIQWTTNLPQSVKSELLGRYKALLAEDLAIEDKLSKLTTNHQPLITYFRLIGFQAQFLSHAGIIHLEGRDKEYARSVIDPLYARWDAMDGGKWSRFWCDTIDENGGMRQPTTHNRWSSQMQWPWNEPADPFKKDRKGVARADYVATAYRADIAEPVWLEPLDSAARESTRRTGETVSSAPRGRVEGSSANGGAWTRVSGLGTSGRALALLPVKPGVGVGARIDYRLPPPLPSTSTSTLILQFLPDYALWPGLKLGVNVQFDDGSMQYVAVPKSDANIGEHDRVRHAAVQDNFIRVEVKIPKGAKGVRVIATDPGIAIDRVGVRF